MGRHRRAETHFRVLFVCTGNLCRSPYGEVLTRHLLRTALGGVGAEGFDVASAGTQAVVGSPMHPVTRAELAPWGLDGAESEAFVARQLTSSIAEGADLILGATLWHRSAVVSHAPTVLPIAFGIREFARLVEVVDATTLPAAPVERAHALVDAARAQRGMRPPVRPEADRIPDPVGRSEMEHRMAAQLIERAVGSIVDTIVGRPAAHHDLNHVADPPSGA